LGRRGVAIDRDHIHSRGARFHLRTTGPSSWSLIGLSQEDLGRFGGPLDAALTKGQERRGIELERTDVLMGGQQLLNQLIAISSPTLPALVARPASAPRCASSNSSPPTSATRIHDWAYARAAEEVLDWCARVGTNTPMRNRQGSTLRLRSGLRLGSSCRTFGVHLRPLRLAFPLGLA
jgi:hypothetical protein